MTETDDPNNRLAVALATLTQVSDPDLTLLCREFNLWLDTVLIRGRRSHFSPTDLTCLFHRMHDIAQVQPLPPEPGQVEAETTLGKAIENLGKAVDAAHDGNAKPTTYKLYNQGEPVAPTIPFAKTKKADNHAS